MRSGKVASLAAILIWFYLFLAVILNPTFDPSDIPNNPLIPFLSAATVDLFWPPVLISSPIVFVAGEHLVKPSGAPRREISPEEFIRIQSRAIRMREADQQSTRRPAPSSQSTPSRETQPSTVTEPIEPLISRVIAEERPTSVIVAAKDSEFTLPPTVPHETAPEESLVAEQDMTTPQTRHELETAAHLGPVDKFKDIEELEAEKEAVASLVEKLEEMNKSGAIQRNLYEKLRRKYGEQMEKIDARIRELSEKIMG